MEILSSGSVANALRLLTAAVAAEVDRDDSYVRLATAQLAALLSDAGTTFSLERLAPTIVAS